MRKSCGEKKENISKVRKKCAARSMPGNIYVQLPGLMLFVSGEEHFPISPIDSKTKNEPFSDVLGS